jgi:hypothetical protein
MKACRRSRGTAPVILNHVTRCLGSGQLHAPSSLPPRPSAYYIRDWVGCSASCLYFVFTLDTHNKHICLTGVASHFLSAQLIEIRRVSAKGRLTFSAPSLSLAGLFSVKHLSETGEPRLKAEWNSGERCVTCRHAKRSELQAMPIVKKK